jgi:hypothetical protein
MDKIMDTAVKINNKINTEFGHHVSVIQLVTFLE